MVRISRRRCPPKAQKSFSCPPVITRELGQDYADRARRILADIQEAGEAMLLDDNVVADGKAKAGSLPGRLGCSLIRPDLQSPLQQKI
jgi:hypothetical protein